MRRAVVELGHQRPQLVAELEAEGGCSLASLRVVGISGPAASCLLQMQDVRVAHGADVRPGEDVDGLSRQVVLVLREEAAAVVGHVRRVVLHRELHIPPLLVGRREERMARERPGDVSLVELADEVLVIPALPAANLVVQLREDAVRAALDEVQAGLVVREVDEGPLDALAVVLVLLDLEDEAVEVLLQRLIGVVDAELLEAVRLEALEAKDVEHADGRPLIRGRLDPDALVHPVNDPVEEVRVYHFHDGRDGVEGLRRRLRRSIGLPLDVNRPLREALEEDVLGHAQQPARHLHRLARLRGVAEVRAIAAIRLRLLERDLAEVENAGENPDDIRLLLLREAQHLHGALRVLKVLHIVDALHRGDAPDADVTEALRRLHDQVPPGDAEALQHHVVPPCRDLVQDVKVPLSVLLRCQAHFLEQVGLDPGSAEVAAAVEKKLDVLAEARRVDVPVRLRVAKGLQNRVRLQHAIGDGAPLGDRAPLRVADGREVPHDDLRGLGLAGSGLAGDEDSLVALEARDLLVHDVHHGAVGAVGHGEDVRADFLGQVRHALAPKQPGVVVLLENLIGVHRQAAVRVHRQQDGAREGVDEALAEAREQRVEDRRLVEKRKVDQILHEVAVLGIPQLQVLRLRVAQLAWHGAGLSVVELHEHVLPAFARGRALALRAERRDGRLNESRFNSRGPPRAPHLGHHLAGEPRLGPVRVPEPDLRALLHGGRVMRACEGRGNGRPKVREKPDGNNTKRREELRGGSVLGGLIRRMPVRVFVEFVRLEWTDGTGRLGRLAGRVPPWLAGTCSNSAAVDWAVSTSKVARIGHEIGCIDSKRSIQRKPLRKVPQ
eukprot:scaffold1070_cov245-Pinguiococcus_pyrenoidosus.AAC.52